MPLALAVIVNLNESEGLFRFIYKYALSDPGTLAWALRGLVVVELPEDLQDGLHLGPEDAGLGVAGDGEERGILVGGLDVASPLGVRAREREPQRALHQGRCTRAAAPRAA